VLLTPSNEETMTIRTLHEIAEDKRPPMDVDIKHMQIEIALATGAILERIATAIEKL
jgi:hypothetical protein